MRSMKVMILWIGYFSLTAFALGGSGAVCARLQVLPYLVSHVDEPRANSVFSPTLKGLRLALAHAIPLDTYPAMVRGGEYPRRDSLASRFSRAIFNQQKGWAWEGDYRQSERLLIPDPHGFCPPLFFINMRKRWVIFTQQHTLRTGK